QIPPGPATTYHYRLVATNAGATGYGEDRTFTSTAVTPPAVSTGPATSVTTTNATLTGTVTPNNWPTTNRFEYRPPTGYSTSVPVPDASLKSETTAEAVSQTIAFPPGPAKTYHFRLVASNAGGTTYGNDQTFTTVAVLAPGVSTGAATNVTATNATLT